MILTFGTTPAIARTMRFKSVAAGGVNRASEVFTYAAGKAVNVARAVRTLGGDVTCLGVQGGMMGPNLLSLLDRDGLAHRFVKTIAPTRLCTTVIDDAKQEATELIEDAPAMTIDDGESLLGELKSMLNGVAVVVFAGSLARGLPADYYAQCIRSVRERGAKVVLDASGEPLRQAIAQKPEVIKINAHELAGLEGGSDFTTDADCLASAKRIAIETGGAVIVTRGGDATLAVDLDGKAWRVEPMRAGKIVSPIGCGDSFAAGVATALSCGEGFAQMLTLGTACAVANVETPHAAHFELPAVNHYGQGVRVIAAQ